MKTIMRDGSGARDYKHVQEDMDRYGKVRLYLRRKGEKKIRLLSTPGTDEFDREYKAALDRPTAPVDAKSASARPIIPNSLRWLITIFYTSSVFLDLDPGTQTVRKRILDAICIKHGHKPYRGMQTPDVAKLRDEKKHVPEAANSRVKALRQLFKWACSPEYNHATHNPTRDVGFLRAKNPDGHHTWTLEEIEQFQATYPIGTKARLAMDLFLYSGVRISDVVRLGRQMERSGWLHFTEKKNGRRKPKHRELPILPILATTISASPTNNLTYLMTEYGRPFSVKGFGNKFKGWCVKAGLPHCTGHGLRKGGATIAAENGATEQQLMAIYGWETSKQADLYTRKANRRKLAGAGMPLINTERTGS